MRDERAAEAELSQPDHEARRMATDHELHCTRIVRVFLSLQLGRVNVAILVDRD